MTITEKTAYLKGLLEGMNIEASTNEGKLLAAIVDVVNDIALELADLELQTETIHDELDAMKRSKRQWTSFTRLLMIAAIAAMMIIVIVVTMKIVIVATMIAIAMIVMKSTMSLSAPLALKR